MPPPRRTTITRPALWITVPTFAVSLAVAASMSAGIGVALPVAFLGAVVVGAFAEARLARIISSIDRIARGDRYTSLPELIGDGSIQQFAGTAETVRAALIEADTLTVDQLRRETEARLHHAGRLFFTGNFRRAVEEVVNAFTSAGERIRRTATELGQSNRDMARQVTQASDAAAQAAEDVAGVAAAARDVEALVMNSAQQVVEARTATKRTTTELARADETMRNLGLAAGRIEEVIKLISAIAGQTSLLALNATIEAARAGDAGRGFAVVAGEVKALAGQTSRATEEIATQIAGMQRATVRSIEAITAIEHIIREIGDISGAIAAAVTEQGAATAEIARSVEIAAKRTVETADEVNLVGTATEGTRSSAGAVKTVADDLGSVAGRIRGQVDTFFERLSA